MSLFRGSAASAQQRQPLPVLMPRLKGAEIALAYQHARIGGDFFDCMVIGRRMVFALLDIAGQRNQAMQVAAAVQDVLRARVLEIFAPDVLNESCGLMELAVDLNRTLLRVADDVRCTPGFIGCYNEDVRTVFFVNAGAVPALLKDTSGVAELPATGLPLGLFWHATYEPEVRALQPGAALVAVTRGVVEAQGRRREEYGVTRLKQAVAGRDDLSAKALCEIVLASVKSFSERRAGRILDRWTHEDSLPLNDRTVVALVRQP